MPVLQFGTFEEVNRMDRADFACGDRVILRSTDPEQTLQLTDAGAERVQDDEQFGELLHDVSEHIASADPIDAALWLPTVLPGSETLKITPNPDRFCVYGTSRPADVVLRIGGNWTEAQMQFDVMSWLHERLHDSPAMPSGNTLRAPKQYALLQASTGTYVSVMERVSGKGLAVPKEYPPTKEETRLMAQQIAPIREHLAYVLGPVALGLLNDINPNKHLANILTDGYAHTIIDQPHLNPHEEPDVSNRTEVYVALKALLGHHVYARYISTFVAPEAS